MSLVSVVIPARDAEGFLGTAIESALRQTHREIEVFVVDDASSDGTAAVARSFSDTRMRVLRGAGQGSAAARNVALAEAHGDYVAFLDADDYWLPEKLERQLEVLRAEPLLAAVGSLMRYEPLTERRVVGVTGGVVTAEKQRQIARGLYLPFPLSSLMAPKLLLEEVGGFDEELKFAQDLELMAQLARLGQMYCIDEVLGAYRVHSASVSHRRFWEQQQIARFIAARLLAVDEGRELTREEFDRTDRLGLNERRTLLSRHVYRNAGIAYAERRWARAALLGAAAVALDPVYVIPRVARQYRRPTLAPDDGSDAQTGSVERKG